MKTSNNLTHETKGNDRIYILWDNIYDIDGQIIDQSSEIYDYANTILSDSNMQIMEEDPSVASYFGYDNCLICGLDEDQ